MNYYNEFDPKAAAALRHLISDGLLPPGEVDTRSIIDVRPSDLKGFTQCHLFAGIGGWPLALQIAGWPIDRPVWTGSYPCQPFSCTGEGEGGGDDRHLWPVGYELKKQCRPATFYGEQVANAISHGWIDRVFTDMEKLDYSCAAAVIPACAVNSPHKRERLFYVAHSASEGFSIRGSSEVFKSGQEQKFKRCCVDGALDNSIQPRLEGFSGHDGREERREEPSRSVAAAGFWDDAEWILCGDGKARRIPPVKSGIRLVAHGVSERVGLIRTGGNAIVPEIAARFIRSTM